MGQDELAGGPLPQVAYYYPAPYWGMPEGDRLKSLLLLFDRVTILRPRYMRGREVAADPARASPRERRGVVAVLQPRLLFDQEPAPNFTARLRRPVRVAAR